jgi:putative hydrolase of the HAD superfamily
MKTTFTDIFFDLDHTLWDFDANSKKAFNKLLKKNNLNIDIDTYCQIYKPINNQYWENYSKNLVSKEQVKYGRLKDTFTSLKIEADNDFIKKFANDYLLYLKEQTELISGSIEILEYLKGKYRLHILTNGFIEIQEGKIKNAGLINFFDHIISSEEIGKQKPHPDVFKYALNKANTLAHKSIMIGDNFKSDIMGARNVGMHAIHFDLYNKNKVDSKIIPKINNLLEIKELL